MRKLCATLAAALMLLPALAGADEASALATIRSARQVMDAVLDNGGNLYVAVKNERANWNAFAGNVCRLLRPHHARIFAVRVVDVTTATYGRPSPDVPLLGQARCSR